jgi:hypothetical protein
MTLRDLAKRLRPSNPYNVRYLERIMRHGGAGFDLAQRMGKLLDCDPMVFLHGDGNRRDTQGRSANRPCVGGKRWY